MDKGLKFITAIALALILGGCGRIEAPFDANGKTPQQVLLETYLSITMEQKRILARITSITSSPRAARHLSKFIPIPEALIQEGGRLNG
jgi:hypothetical protein